MILYAILACPVWAFYTLSAWAIGALALRHFYPAFNNDKIAHPALSLSLGMGVLGTIWSALAIIPNGMQTWSVLLVLSVPLCFGWHPIYDYVRRIDYRALIPKDKNLRWIAAPLVIFLALVPLMTLHPMGIDALAYYFAQAKLVAYTQGFAPLPGYDSFGQIALPAEFTYSALLLIGPEFGARLITASVLWTCALLIVALVKSCGASEVGRWIAILFLLTSTCVTLLISDGKTDLYGAMLAFATLYLFVASPDLGPRHITLMGMFAGMAVMAKLSFIPILIPMLGFLLLWRFMSDRTIGQALKKTITSGVTISSLVLFNALLLVLKNYFFYKEPFAPFYFFDPASDIGLSSQVWYSPENTTWILKTYPLVWTFGQYPMQHGVLSPLVWAALPALLLVKWKNIDWKRDPAVALAIAGALGMLVWAVFFPGTVAPRYIFPALFAFVPLAVRGLEYLWKYTSTNKLRYFFYTGLIFLFACIPLYYNLSEVKNGLRMATRGVVKSHVNYIYEGLQKGEKTANETARVFLLGWERAPLSPKTLSCLASYLD